MANVLSNETRARMVACLVEGMSLRATARITGVAFNSVLKFVPTIGEACANYQDQAFRELKCKRLQCDEIWSFVGAKEKNATPEMKARGMGDVWTWLAIDADTKLVPCWFIGPRDAESANAFMGDLASRLASRVQLTTDGLKCYINAVDEAFGGDIDFAQLIKIYGNGPNTPETRYSPPPCVGTQAGVVSGEPDGAEVSTSYVERQNLNMRMGMRRFTRLTNAFSKKLENHAHAVALYYMFYNFCRIHQTLRVTPAMEAGVSDHVWSIDEIVDLLT